MLFMMGHMAGNKVEHFSVAEFFSHMTCNFCDLEFSGYSEIHANSMKYDGMPLKELMSMYTVVTLGNRLGI